MMPAVAGPASICTSGQQELIQDTAGDSDAGVIQQEFRAVDIPGDGAAGGEIEFAVMQVVGYEGSQLVEVLGKHQVLRWVASFRLYQWQPASSVQHSSGVAHSRCLALRRKRRKIVAVRSTCSAAILVFGRLRYPQ